MSTPKEQWQMAEALIYSCDWIKPDERSEGYYGVVYSYKVG